MKEYWLYTDGDPHEEYEDWGIFEFEYSDIDEDDNHSTLEATPTKVIYSTFHVALKEFYTEVWEDAITSDPRRIIPFLFDQRF